MSAKTWKRIGTNKIDTVHDNERKQPPEAFYEKDFLRNFAKFTGKHLCQNLFFNKVAGGPQLY